MAGVASAMPAAVLVDSSAKSLSVILKSGQSKNLSLMSASEQRQKLHRSLNRTKVK
jgi:hypothetical protein